MRLSFDRRLYNRRAVDAASAAYAEVARSRVTETEGSIVVELSPLDKEHDPRLADEFSNHVLGEMRP